MSSDLAASPEFLAILNGSLDPIGIVDTAGRYTWVNEAAALFLGFEPGELIGMHFRNLLADDEGTGDAMRRARLGRPAAVVRRVRRKDQTIAVMRTELIPLGDQGAVLIHGTDLTVLYDTLDRVSESESVLARAQEIGHTGSWVLRLPEQTVRWFGPLGDLVDLIDLAPGGTIDGSAIADHLVHPEDRRIPSDIVRDAINDGEAVGAFRIIDAQQRARWLRMYAQAQRDEATGQVVRVEGVMHDVTESRAQDERYRELLDAVRVPMMIWTRAEGERDPAIRYVNQPLCDLLGTRVEEMVGVRPAVWMDEAELPAIVEHMARAASGERLPPMQLSMRRVDGSFATCLVVAAQVTYEAHDALCAQLVDISEEVRLRSFAVQSRETDLALAVAAGVAHDFNNLLAGVLGYLDLAVAELEEGSPEARVVQSARLAARRAANLAHALLGFSRAGAGAANDRGDNAAPVSVVDVTDVMREAYAIMRATIDRSVTMVMHEDEQPVHVAIAADSLLRVLVNLIVNARDTALERAGRGDATYRPRIDLGVEMRGDVVEVWVADNGVGIPEEIGERVFEPYFTTKAANGGSGIGLRAARDLAQGAGGDLTFRSQVDVGTRFTLSLPLVSAPITADL